MVSIPWVLEAGMGQLEVPSTLWAWEVGRTQVHGNQITQRIPFLSEGETEAQRSPQPCSWFGKMHLKSGVHSAPQTPSPPLPAAFSPQPSDTPPSSVPLWLGGKGPESLSDCSLWPEAAQGDPRAGPLPSVPPPN